MKKIIAILMLMTLVLPMTGCKSGQNEPLQQQVEQLEKKAAEKEKKEKENKEKAEKEKAEAESAEGTEESAE